MTTNFSFALKWMLYFVRFNAETNVAEITLWTQEKFELNLEKLEYMISPPNMGIDATGIFLVDTESYNIRRPFTPIFTTKQRRCYQCEFDEYCFKNEKEDERFKTIANGNIKVWEEVCKRLS